MVATRPRADDRELVALGTPDMSTCEDCLAELWDPADRRYRYPFIDCTNCGPRFTIARAVPYDRALTTMAGFDMCADCRAEYEDPRDRRFQAEPNACPDCGPSLTLVEPDGRPAASNEEALAATAGALLGGSVVAVKGLGGFHLACLAGDEAAVGRLRERKRSGERPFAVMVADLEQARALVSLSGEEQSLLCSPARPTVLAPRKPGTAIAAGVAPRLDDLGVMLPNSPVHHLLLADVGQPLVMASGNRSDEPIAYRDEEALCSLAGIAELLLVHDRQIETRTDDSVVRARVAHRGSGCSPLVVRRSRGHAPEPLALPIAASRPLLACGAELRATFCVAEGRRAWVSHHIGDLSDRESLRSFRAGVVHFERLFAVSPALLVHEAHPDCASSRYARARADAEGLEAIAVQHHHAHLAACLAEHGERGPAIGAIYDGSGYGTDGTVWGGELLVGDLRSCERAGNLWPVPMPGGGAAVREPWRMACTWLGAALGEKLPPLPRALAQEVDDERWRIAARLADSPLAPVTTSMGRLFDALAALCGVRARVSYEGQAAAELEAAAAPAHGAYELPLLERDGRLLLDARATVAQAHRALGAGAAPGEVAWRFQAAVAESTAKACAQIADARRVSTVVLCGGVFQNRRLLGDCERALKEAGLRVLVPERLPPDDGAISYGQAAIASARDSVVESS